MIIGLGIDIADQTRIREGIARHADRFLQRLFTAQEIAYCQHYRDPTAHYAGRFAVKEAFMKAIGRTQQTPVFFLDIEVLNHDSGAPHIVPHRVAAELCLQKGVQQIHVTLSHSAGIAAAVVVLEG